MTERRKHVLENQTLDELLARASALRGLSLGELAQKVKLTLSSSYVNQKGKQGELFEHLLGAYGGSFAVVDFPHLGVELKTIPLKASGTPKESTYVCKIDLARAETEEWETSWVREKLSKVLWVSFLAESNNPFERIVQQVHLWSPSKEEEALLKEDYELLMGLLGSGRVEFVHGRLGKVLQIRPKARDGRVRVRVRAEQAGEMLDFSVNPKGFYLRPSFTKSILEKGANPSPYPIGF